MYVVNVHLWYLYFSIHGLFLYILYLYIIIYILYIMDYSAVLAAGRYFNSI